MFSLVALLLFAIYYYTLHQKVLDKIGFSRRDDGVMTIGFMVNSIIVMSMNVIKGLMVFQVDIIAIITIGLFCFIVRSQYRRL
jgi:hypothetical protein